VILARPTWNLPETVDAVDQKLLARPGGPAAGHTGEHNQGTKTVNFERRPTAKARRWLSSQCPVVTFGGL